MQRSVTSKWEYEATHLITATSTGILSYLDEVKNLTVHVHKACEVASHLSVQLQQCILTLGKQFTRIGARCTEQGHFRVRVSLDFYSQRFLNKPN